MDTNSRYRSVGGQQMDANAWRPQSTAAKTNQPPNSHSGGSNSNGHPNKLHQNIGVTVQQQQPGNIVSVDMNMEIHK